MKKNIKGKKKTLIAFMAFCQEAKNNFITQDLWVFFFMSHPFAQLLASPQVLSWCLSAGVRCSVPAPTQRSSARWRGCSPSTCRREQNSQALQLPRNTQLPMATTEIQRNNGVNHERQVQRVPFIQNVYIAVLVG